MVKFWIWGAARGGNSIFLAERGFNVTCTDKDKEVISAIKENYPNINAINQNILEFSFPKDEYDLVLAFNVLNFFKLENVKTIINNIIKSLKKDGLIYAQVFSINNPDKRFSHLFTKEEVSELFSQNKVLELEELLTKDNHPPSGKHEHDIIRLLVRK